MRECVVGSNVVFLMPVSPICNSNVVDFFDECFVFNAFSLKSGKTGKNVVFIFLLIQFVNANWTDY